MTPPMPVPSKAAIRALRGLALGTTCVIGVIVEDRRRRISTLHKALSNKEKLQSARRFRSTPEEAASWLPFDEDAVAVRSVPAPYDRQPAFPEDLEPHPDEQDGQRKERSDFFLPDPEDDLIRPHINSKPPRGSLSSVPSFMPASSPQAKHYEAQIPVLPNIVARRSSWGSSLPNSVPTTAAQSGQQRRETPVQSNPNANSASTTIPHPTWGSTKTGTEPRPTAGPHQKRDRVLSSTAHSKDVSATTAKSQKKEKRDPPVRPHPNPMIVGSNPVSSWGRGSTGSTYDPKHLSSIIAKIEAALADPDEESGIKRAVFEFESACGFSNAYATHGPAWREISAALSRQCQRRGKWDQARSIVRIALSSGPIEEAEYFAHDPFPLIRHIISVESADSDPPYCPKENFVEAYDLFMARFFRKPEMNKEQVDELGRELITHGLRLNDIERCHEVYRRVRHLYWRLLPVSTKTVNDNGFVGWYIRKIVASRHYKDAIKYFGLNYVKTEPTFDCIQSTIDSVVEAVVQGNGDKAEDVIQAYVRIEGMVAGMLRSRWVLRLFNAHRDHYKDFDRSRALFEFIKSSNLLEKMFHGRAMYILIICAAVDADRFEAARQYLEEAKEHFPSIGGNMQVQGAFAHAKARQGDWEAVEDIFMGMKLSLKSPDQADHYSHSFVKVLKEFASKNSVEDVRSFVDHYMANHNVKLDKYVLTLVTTKYYESPDVNGFFSWIESTFRSGMALQPEFGSLFLGYFKQRWKMPYHQLRQIAWKMKDVYPQSYNLFTKSLLRSAATTGRTGSPRKVHDKGLAMRPRALVGKTTDVWEIWNAMSVRVAGGKPEWAVRIYKRAFASGVPYDERRLRLAVYASFQRPDGHEEAFNLIKEACTAGYPIHSAVTMYVRQSLNGLRNTTDVLMRHMQDMVNKFQKLGVHLDPHAFANLAITCVKLNQIERAKILCKLSMERAGSSNPCFSRQSLRAYMMMYTRTLDVEGMEWLIKAIPSSELATEPYTMIQLKSHRGEVRAMSGDRELRVKMYTILQHGIDLVTAAKAEEREVIVAAKDKALKIMQDAVERAEEQKRIEEEMREYERLFDDERYEQRDGRSHFYMKALVLQGQVEKTGHRVYEEKDWVVRKRLRELEAAKTKITMVARSFYEDDGGGGGNGNGNGNDHQHNNKSSSSSSSSKGGSRSGASTDAHRQGSSSDVRGTGPVLKKAEAG